MNIPLTVVPRVDLNRYMGTWYEIAKFPNRFQSGCDAATANYTLRPDGIVRVVNRCVSPDGGVRQIEGKAWVTDPTTNAKLRVRFFWPFSGAYWVIDLGENYEYAVISEPKRKYLWILARDPAIRREDLAPVLDRLSRNEFDLSRLIWSRHPPVNPAAS